MNETGRFLRLLPALGLGLVLSACDSGPERVPVSDSWVRIDAAGQPLADTGAADHACVLDERTGLMWEVKRAGSALHDPEASFSWYSDDPALHLSVPGERNGGRCKVGQCDTAGLVEAVNAAGLCGHRDWRLPLREELLTLGDSLLAGTGLVVEPEFFPHVMPVEYWSSSTYRLYPQSAWAVNAGHGLDRADYKREPKAVRLVRRHQQPRGESP